jgi:hypothetical protein
LRLDLIDPAKIAGWVRKKLFFLNQKTLTGSTLSIKPNEIRRFLDFGGGWGKR